MRDQAIGQPDVRSLALAEPIQHVRCRWIVGLTLASLGMWMATQTPLQVIWRFSCGTSRLSTRSSRWGW